MNLTKEHFDKALKGLATKSDLEEHLRALMAYTDDRLESLARIVQAGFEDMQQRFDVHERIEKLEKDMKKIKEALHV
jgi:hypothetical protein